VSGLGKFGKGQEAQVLYMCLVLVQVAAVQVGFLVRPVMAQVVQVAVLVRKLLHFFPLGRCRVLYIFLQEQAVLVAQLELQVLQVAHLI
jgi:hypothetical protein